MEQYALMPPYLHMLTPVQRKVHNSDSLMGRLDRLEALVSHSLEQLANLMRGSGLHPMSSLAAGLRRADGGGGPPVVVTKADGGSALPPSGVAGDNGMMGLMGM